MEQIYRIQQVAYTCSRRRSRCSALAFFDNQDVGVFLPVGKRKWPRPLKTEEIFSLTVVGWMLKKLKGIRACAWSQVWPGAGRDLTRHVWDTQDPTSIILIRHSSSTEGLSHSYTHTVAKRNLHSVNAERTLVRIGVPVVPTHRGVV